MTKLKLLAFFAIAVLFQIHVTECAIGTANCRYTTTPGAEFAVDFQLDTEGVSVTNLTFYNASENPDFTSVFDMAPCLDDSPSGTTFNVQFDVDTDNLPCGAEVDNSGTQFTFAAVASLLNQVYIFTCDTTNLPALDTSVSDSFTTPVTEDTLHPRFNAKGISAEIVQHNEGRVPINSVELAELIKIRVTLDTYFTERGPDNTGFMFHTAPMIHAVPVSNVTLTILTLSLGTRVHVTGSLAGSKLDIWRYVKVGNPAYVNIPVAYVTNEPGAERGLIENKGVKIESTDAEVGVILTTATVKGKSKVLVLPDDILDYRYRLTAVQDWYVTIVGTMDGTTLNITTNTFGMAAANITLFDGMMATDLESVPLEEGETLTINCGFDPIGQGCVPVFVTADQPIAVVVGGAARFDDSFNDGELATQIPGLSSYSRRFSTYFQGGFIPFGYYVFTDAFEINETFEQGTFDNATVRVGEVFFFAGDDVIFDDPVLILMGFVDPFTGPAINILPSVEQWGVYQSILIKEGTHYGLAILALAGETASITFNVYGVEIDLPSINGTLGGIDGFHVDPVSGVDGIDREEFLPAFTVTSDGSNQVEYGILTFHSGASHKPFLVVAYEFSEIPPFYGSTTEFPFSSSSSIGPCCGGLFGSTIQSDAPASSVTAFGTRFPPINPCKPTMSNHSIHPDFHTTYYVGPGDMLDNDCDGRVDEEFEDGLADLLTDNDNLVDEDLAFSETENAVGVHVTKTMISNTADFTGAFTQTVHTAGCNLNDPGTAIGSISEFKHNSALSPIFDQFYVIQTDAFKAFGWIWDGTNPNNPVYFRIYYDFCYGTLTDSLCENSCSLNRRKRSSDVNQGNFVDLHFDVKTNKTTLVNNVNVHIKENMTTDSGSEQKHACSTQSEFWVTATLFLLMMLIESAVVVILFYRRSAFKHISRKYA